MIKNIFATGLIATLPIAFTYIIIKFILDIITMPFIGLFSEIVEPNIPKYLLYRLQDFSILFLVLKQLTILSICFIAIFFIGVLVKHIMSPSIIRFFQYITDNIPVINLIFNTSKQVISTIFKKDSLAFKYVVIVKSGDNSIFGLLGSDANISSFSDLQFREDDKHKEEYVSVFIPTAPSPLTGFVILCKREDIKYTSLKIEDLFKRIISLGLIH